MNDRLSISQALDVFKAFSDDYVQLKAEIMECMENARDSAEALYETLDELCSLLVDLPE